MKILINEEKIRQEIEEKVRAELELQRVIAEKEANKRIKEAEREAEHILKTAEMQRKEIIRAAQAEIEREKQKWQEKAKECERLKQTVLGLKKIIRQKNLAHLRNLAKSVPNARVKRELIKSNRQLIWLEDIYEAIDRVEKED